MRRVTFVLTVALIMTALFVASSAAAMAGPPPNPGEGVCTAHEAAPEFAQGHPHIPPCPEE